MRRLVASLVLLVLSTSGCSMFRAQLGGGLGLGAEIKLPGLAHTGLGAGTYRNLGIRYDSPELSDDASATLLAWHWEGRQSRRPEQGRRFIVEHSCWGGLPPYTTMVDEDPLAIWDFEIGLNLLVIDIRLGFNPLRLGQPRKRSLPPPIPANPAGLPRSSSSNEEVTASTSEDRVSGPPRPASAPKQKVFERDPLLPAVDPPPESIDDDERR